MDKIKFNKINSSHHLKIVYSPIGIIYTPFKEISNMPVQTIAAKGIEGKIVIFPEYQEGLEDLEGFSHIILIYHFHKIKGYSLKVKPFLDDEERGLFSTRAPKRPNPIGISIVKLKKIEGNVIYIEDVDILNETPLLDIKPYVPEFDSRKEKVKIGWLEGKVFRVYSRISDNRFTL